MTSTRLQDIQSLCVTLKQKRQSFQQKWHHVQEHLDHMTNNWKQEVYLLAANNQLLRDEVNNLHYELLQLQTSWRRPGRAEIQQTHQGQELARQWEIEFFPFKEEHARLWEEFHQLQTELQGLQARIQARAAGTLQSGEELGQLQQQYAAQLEQIAQLEAKLQQQQQYHQEIQRLEAQLQNQGQVQQEAAHQEERTQEMQAQLEHQQQHFISQLAEKNQRLQELENHLQALQQAHPLQAPSQAETQYEAMEGLTQEMQGETLIAPEEISHSISQQFQQMSSLLKEFRNEDVAAPTQPSPASTRELLLYGENLSFIDQWDEQLKAYLKEFNLTHRWIGRKALQLSEPLQAAGVVFLQAPGTAIPGDLVAKVRQARLPYIEHRLSNITRLKIEILDTFIR